VPSVRQPGHGPEQEPPVRARARGRPEDSRHYFNEIIVFSENLIHTFLRSKKSPNHAACFVCRATANIGMVLSKSRVALLEVEKA
jgi:hypothetical protein